MKTEILQAGLLTVHLLGVLVLVLCMGADLLTLTQVRKCKTPDELENVTRAIRFTSKAVPITVVVAAATGVWMVLLKNSEFTPSSGWVVVALSATVAILLDCLWSWRPLANIYTKARNAHTTPGNVKSIAFGVRLLRHTWVRTAALAGFVVIMVTRPGFWMSVAVMAGVSWAAVMFVHFALPEHRGAWLQDRRDEVGGG